MTPVFPRVRKCVLSMPLHFFSWPLILFLALPVPVRAESVTYTGDAANLKTATIGGADASPGSVFPGVTNSPLASGNTVNINFSSGTNPYRVFGGLSDTLVVSGNTVDLITGTVNNDLYGGYDVAGNSAAGNTVVMGGGSVARRVVGGISLEGNASGNGVTLTGGQVSDGGFGVYGGVSNYTGNASVTNNWVKISAGTVAGYVESGVAYGSGEVSGNSVEWTAGR